MMGRTSPKKDPPEPPAEVSCSEDPRLCDWEGTDDELVEIETREYDKGVVEVDWGCPECEAQVGPTRLASEPDLEDDDE